MLEYRDKLSNPKWKKKHQKILKRDEYKCTVCGSKSHLQVHHTFYYSDKPDPWKYPDDSLLTVCRECHKKYHEYNEIEIKPPPGKKRKKKMFIHNKSKIIEQKVNGKKLSIAEIQMIRGLRIRERIIK